MHSENQISMTIRNAVVNYSIPMGLSRIISAGLSAIFTTGFNHAFIFIWRRISLRASARSVIFSCLLEYPISLIRQILPFNGPNPPAISMPYVSLSCVRTVASSTPSGMQTVRRDGKRYSAGTKNFKPKATSLSQRYSAFYLWRIQRASRPSSRISRNPSRKP